MYFIMRLNRQVSSFLVCSLLLDVEVLDLVGALVGGNDIEELTEGVLLEVLLGEVLEVALRETDVGLDSDAPVVRVHLHALSEVASATADLDAGSEELSEVAGVEDLVLDGLGAVDGEGVRDLGIIVLLLGDLSSLGDLGLLCGHNIC